MGQVKVPGKGQFRPQQAGCYHAHVLVPGAGAVKQHAIAPVHRQVFPGVKTQARHAVHLAQRGAQLQRLAGTVLPHSLQFLDGQVIIALAGGDFRCGALSGFHLAQNAALETDQAFAAAQDILLAGQKLFHPQLRAVHRHPHVGGVIRQADEKIILQGRVTVNGKPVIELGTKVSPTDRILIDGRPLRKERHRYFLLNKPPAVMTTMKDPRGRRTVAELMDKERERVYPVGRLDFMTEGLLIMTNDGALAQGMTHPSYHINKTYEVVVDGHVEEEKLDKLRTGIRLCDGMTAPALVEVKRYDSRRDQSIFEVTIHEGRNRQVRRMCEAIGYPVRKLKRTQVAFLSLQGVKKGAYRELTDDEVVHLKKLVMHHE